MAVDAVKMARQFADDVEFYTEDAGRSDPAYVSEMIAAMIDAGAGGQHSRHHGLYRAGTVRRVDPRHPGERAGNVEIAGKQKILVNPAGSYFLKT